MRLYLSSHRLGERAGALLALLGNGKRAALIANARDHLAPTARALALETEHAAGDLAGLGITATELDLRAFTGDPAGLRRRLEAVDLVWVTDGNPFVLRRAMALSYFDEVMTDLLAEDRLVYGGAGAGAVVAAPSLRGFEAMYDPAAASALEPHWEGLGLIDHAIVPHTRSPHPLSLAAERVSRHLCARGLRYRALPDGESVVWIEARTRQAATELGRLG